MDLDEVEGFLQQVDELSIEVWVDGGWAIDALLGRQTRPHGDLDIAVEERDVPQLRKLLGTKGFREIAREDSTSWNFVLGNERGHEIDFHVFGRNRLGDGTFGPIERGIKYPTESLTGMGVIASVEVMCISPEYLVYFRTLHEPREFDHADVRALCDKFGIQRPEKYS